MAREIFKGTQAECQAAINKVNTALGLSGESIDFPTELDATNDIYMCIIDGATQKNSLSTAEKAKVLAEQDEEIEYLKNEKSFERHVNGKVSYTRVGTIVLLPNLKKFREGDTVTWTASASTGTEKTKFLFDRGSWKPFQPSNITATTVQTIIPRSGSYDVVVYSAGFGGKKQTVTINF
tara:strand:+ start:41 stop:577 length:537 start_codon:yes stop_codon:yes gene_type:complete